MEKTSKIFNQLQSNSEKQNEKIYQLHQQSLRALEMKLTDSWSIKLNQIEKDLKNEYTLKIQKLEQLHKQQQTNSRKKHKETIKELEKNNLKEIVIYCVIVLIVGIIAGAILFQSDWQIPKHMQYKHKEANQKYITAPATALEYNKEKTQIFIKITE